MNQSQPSGYDWFVPARFGIFIHWGIYSLLERGEQVLFREKLPQKEYHKLADEFRPNRFNANKWAGLFKQAGAKYAVLTTKHHDGFCLFDSQLTDYTSVKKAAKRDIVAEYVEGCRENDLRVGLYFSLADWNYSAYWNGPEVDPEGWRAFREYTHGQVRELCTNYGQIDVLWFDGAWPHDGETWGSQHLREMIRALQPNCLVNNRIGDDTLGDFGTPEHKIVRESGRPWESCQVPNWRLWGYTKGEQWRPTGLLIDNLVECAAGGGNLLLNTPPMSDGRLPQPFVEQLEQMGAWLDKHSDAIYGSDGHEVCEFITYGRQTVKANRLFLCVRFWHGDTVHMAGLETPVKSARLLTTDKPIAFRQEGDHLWLTGLPHDPPDPYCSVIELTCDGKPEAAEWAKNRLWQGDPKRMADWAAFRAPGMV